MFERLLVLALVAALAVLAVLVVRAWVARQTRRVLAAPGSDLWETLGTRPDGRATLVAFSTPSCAACHTAQAPALTNVQRQLGASAVRVIHVDAARKPGVARAFGVVTVPSTVVMGTNGRVVAVNHGFAHAEKLAAQLA